MNHIQRAIEKQKQPLPEDQQAQQQQAPPPQQAQQAPAQQPEGKPDFNIQTVLSSHVISMNF